MIIDDTIVNSEKLFNYILSSDKDNNSQNTQQQPPNQKQECSVDEITGICSGGSCLSYSSLDDNNMFLNESYSFLNDDTSTQKIATISEQSSEKRQKMDTDYERLMAERGELMAKPSFA